MKAYVRVLTAIGLLVWAAALAGCGGESGNTVTLCVDNSNCSGGMFCIEGKCQLPIECSPEIPCPQGKKCLLSAQICVDASSCACETDEECPEGTGCTECKCVGAECGEGDAKTCWNGVHKGEQVCDKGFWSLCDASPCSEHETDCENGIEKISIF